MNRRIIPQPGDTSAVQVSVFRIEPGCEVMVRALSDSYGGLMTHWHRRSHYCPGVEECPPAVHRIGGIWKGYAPVEIFTDPNYWVPYVLEISENAEQDLRGVWTRGQCWKFGRLPEQKKKHQPIRATLIDQGDPDSVRQPFDVRPILVRLYHVPHIALTTPNPLPPRTLLAATIGTLPRTVAPSEDKPATISMKELAEKRGMSHVFNGNSFKMPD